MERWGADAPGAPLLLNRFCRNSFRHERFDHVAGFDIAVVGDGDAALHTAGYLGRIVLEAPQRRYFSLEDHHIIAWQTGIADNKNQTRCRVQVRISL
jgi:hypothetical protein